MEVETNAMKEHMLGKTTKINEQSKAPNAFFIFLHEFRHQLAKNGNVNYKIPEISSMAGQKWRQMSEKDKLPYIVWARKNKELSDRRLKTKKRVHGRKRRGDKKKSTKTKSKSPFKWGFLN